MADDPQDTDHVRLNPDCEVCALAGVPCLRCMGAVADVDLDELSPDDDESAS